MTTKKTTQEIEAQVRHIMQELHGRVYVWRKCEIWNEMTNTVKMYIITYRKGKIEICPNWTKEEVREMRLKELDL